ncbi:hypothetical protein MTO96_031649 [Rhipicephalus appendiculatus]
MVRTIFPAWDGSNTNSTIKCLYDWAGLCIAKAGRESCQGLVPETLHDCELGFSPSSEGIGGHFVNSDETDETDVAETIVQNCRLYNSEETCELWLQDSLRKCRKQSIPPSNGKEGESCRKCPSDIKNRHRRGEPGLKIAFARADLDAEGKRACAKQIESNGTVYTLCEP